MNKRLQYTLWSRNPSYAFTENLPKYFAHAIEIEHECVVLKNVIFPKYRWEYLISLNNCENHFYGEIFFNHAFVLIVAHLLKYKANKIVKWYY